jgi:predicted metal-dependent peptidase
MLLENLNIYVSKDIPTAAVDPTGTSMYLNPDFVETLSNTHLAFLVSHEVAHIAFNSFGRRKWREHQLWNAATDYAINDVLKASFGSMPASGLYDVKYNDMSAEEIYEELLKEDSSTPSRVGLAPNDMMTDGAKEDMVKVQIKVSRQDKQQQESDDGTQSPVSTKIDWNAEVTKALTHAKMQGDVSSDFERKVNGESSPQVDWRAVLRQKVSHLLSRDGRDDFSYIPPNRRYVYQDLILPSAVGHRQPTLAYCIDTSGSMSPEELSQGLAELDAIRQVFQARLYFIVCDYDVTTSQWIETHETLPKLTGGGGTSFIPIFDKLEEEHVECDATIVFTDGYGEFPASDRGYETVWVLTSSVTPPFGECINVKIPARCSQ